MSNSVGVVPSNVMDRKTAILVAMAPANGAIHTPVQLQKLMFVLDKKKVLNKSALFRFEPYDYGPFDKVVYQELENMESSGLIAILRNPELRWKKYRTTSAGQDAGEKALAALGPQQGETVRRLSSFVRSLSFADLVAAIYRAYPEMQANSVFRQ